MDFSDTPTRNIFSAVPLKTAEEEFLTLMAAKGVKIERIVSNGQVTPEGEWYDQAQDEWVLLLQGSAEILVEGEGVPIKLQTGDYLLLPAHCRHRVIWTDPDRPTVWLAVHFGGLQ
jgi:cupin 2 domain-containing protein